MRQLTVHRLRLAAPLLLLIGPAALLLVFGVVRDVPPAAECGEGNAGAAVLADYRAGAVAIVLAAEAVTLGVWLAGLRLSRGEGRSGLSIPIVAAAAGLAAALPLWDHEPDNLVALGAITGVAAGALTVAVGRTALGRGWSWGSLGVALAIAAVGSPPGLIAAWLAALVPGVAATIVTAIAIVLSWRADRSGRAAAFAALAAFVAVFVLPLAYLIIVTRGDQPILC